jgi:hypothetical protein
MTDGTHRPKKALLHIQHLAETIGGRGSCTQAEREAGGYVADQLRAIGVSRVNIQKFQAVKSTYQPFVLAFSTALIGTLLVWIAAGRLVLFLGFLLNLLGAWGMLVETDISPSWMRRLLPKSESLNVTGVVPAARKSYNKVVLCAHLDTHRTPIFYSSPTWHKLFGLLVSAALISMLASAVVYGLGALLVWNWVRWIGLVFAPMVIFSLSMCLHADLTPFSPGANDNGSGVAVVLGLAEQLVQDPLETTEVRFVFTGCEEVWAYGMQAYLDSLTADLDNEVVFLILDEVGFGTPKFLSVDGVVRKHKTHPLALELASRAATALPDIEVLEKSGVAYTDALAATKRGLIALSIGTHSDAISGTVSHWHQMSDTVDTIHPGTLEQIHTFTWKVLEEIDRWMPLLNDKISAETHS